MFQIYWLIEIEIVKCHNISSKSDDCLSYLYVVLISEMKKERKKNEKIYWNELIKIDFIYFYIYFNVYNLSRDVMTCQRRIDAFMYVCTTCRMA